MSGMMLSLLDDKPGFRIWQCRERIAEKEYQVGLRTLAGHRGAVDRAEAEFRAGGTA